MTKSGGLMRMLASLGLAAVIGLAVAPAAQAASYPPATTGTFAVTAHAGANPVTVNGLGAHAAATAIISGSGPAPALGSLPAAVRSGTVNLPLGRTDAAGSITFTLVFPAHASGLYNVSVSTPDGRSVSGSVTIPDRSGNALAWTGTNIALWVVWLAGLLIIAGVVTLVVVAVRRRRRRQ